MESGYSVSAPAGVVVPPLNFAMVSPGIYRSGYPRAVNHTFLRSINLKTVIYLCPEDYSEANIKLCEEEGITLLQFGIQGNKEPFVDIPEHVRCRSPRRVALLRAGESCPLLRHVV
jgi:tyrosine-protein phosphatase SIW14